jgi:hypothetical protein
VTDRMDRATNGTPNQGDGRPLINHFPCYHGPSEAACAEIP